MPPYVLPGVYSPVYPMYYPGMYHHGIPPCMPTMLLRVHLHPTLSGMLSVLRVTGWGGERPWGSVRKNPMGGEAMRRIELPFLLPLLGVDAQSYSVSRVLIG